MEYDLSAINLTILFTAGIASGFINTMAGGGSLLTLPALMLLGLPADLANGTNRLSVLSQSVAAVLGFHGHGKFELKAFAGIAIPAAIGSLVGSLTASYVPIHLLKPALLGSMIGMAALMAVRPNIVAPPEGTQALSVRERPFSIFWLFCIGLYGGFVQAGVGFLALMLLGPLLRYDLVRANALKMALSAIFGIIPLTVFVLAGHVVWVPAIILAVSTVVGAKLGVRFAVNAKPETLRYILFAMVLSVVTAAYLKG